MLPPCLEPAPGKPLHHSPHTLPVSCSLEHTNSASHLRLPKKMKTKTKHTHKTVLFLFIAFFIMIIVQHLLSLYPPAICSFTEGTGTMSVIYETLSAYRLNEQSKSWMQGNPKENPGLPSQKCLVLFSSPAFLIPFCGKSV